MSIPDFSALVAENWPRAVMRASHELQAFRPQLLAALTANDPEVRSAAVATFCEADAGDVHDDVLSLLDDPVASVREEVAEYLSELAVDADIPRLVARLEDQHARFHLTKALCRLTGWSDGLLVGDEADDVTRAVIARWRDVSDQRDDRCHFCGSPRSAAKALVDGPRVFICADCVDACAALLPDRDVRGVTVKYRPPGPAATAPSDGLDSVLASLGPHCGFCGKRDREVAVLVEGYVTRICDECVTLCRRILEEQGIPSPS